MKMFLFAIGCALTTATQFTAPPTSSNQTLLSIVVGATTNERCCIGPQRPGCACYGLYSCSLGEELICQVEEEIIGPGIVQVTQFRMICIDAYCVETSDYNDTCDTISRNRRINLCETTGETEPCPAAQPACPANMAGGIRCKFVQTPYHESYQTWPVKVCKTGSTPCSTGQPANACN